LYSILVLHTTKVIKFLDLVGVLKPKL